MSKKIMKRGLALGALMAFVITGSAWAYTDVNGNLVPGADESKITGEQITTRITDYVTLAGQDGVVENKKITNITTSDYQGGVVKVTSKATFDNCIFSGNKLTSPASTAEGGVIYVGGSGNVTITSSTFENNTVQSAKGSHRSYGAAIASSGTLTIDGCKFGKHIAIGSNNPYGVVIRVGGGVASISNTEFIDSVGSGWSTGVTKNGKDAIYINASTGAVLDLKNVTFENSSFKTGNFINGEGKPIINISSDNEKVNIFKNSDGRAIYNTGELNFLKGSVTKFENNDVDIENKYDYSVINIEEDAVVTIIEGLEDKVAGKREEAGKAGISGKGTVNFKGGTFNGIMNEFKDTGLNTVNFTSGIWNMTGDSTIKHLNGVLNVQGEGNTLNVIDADSKGAIYNAVVKDAEPIGDINVGKLYAESTANALSSYGDLAVTANEIELKAGSNGIYLEDSGSEVIMNTNKLTVNAKGNGINVNKPYDTLEITGTGENSIVTITADGNGVITRDGYDVSGGHDEMVTINANTVNITSTGTDEVSRYDKGNAILAQGEDSIVTVKGGAVNITSGKDGVTALKGGTAIVTGNNIKIDVDSAEGYNSYVYGVHAGERSIGNGSVTIGEANTTSVIIEVNGKDATGIFARAYNNSGKAEDQSSVTVKGAKLDITVDGTGDGITGVWAASGTESKNAPSSIVTLETADTKISATNGVGIVSYSNGTVDVKGNLDIDAKYAIQTRGYAKTFINATKDKTVTIDGDIAFTKEYDQTNIITDAEVVLNLSDDKSYLEGNIYVDNFDSVVNNKATYKDITGMDLGIYNGAYWATQVADGAVDNFVNDLTMSNGTIKHNNAGNITVTNYTGDGTVAFNSDGHLHIDSGFGKLNLTAVNLTVDKFNDVAGKLGVKEDAKDIEAKMIIAEDDIVGETIGVVTYAEDEVNGYYHGLVAKENITEKANTKNQAISDAGIGMKLHNRAHMDDMNKRMGELRDANGEHGVWTRVVRGESEYKNTKAQYNQYQLGYDEKLSVDERWSVGAAVTFADGDSNYGYGSTEDKSTAFAIYGTKLNNDGTFVDLIARYAHLESDYDDVNSGKGDYSTNGMSVSAEFGKRIQQGNGLWVEPQFELTYGTIDSAEFQLGQKTVTVGDMDSLIGRVGFSLGKDIKQGNVYARASYLYDFDGETENVFSNATDSRAIAEDLGGGWWEVGVGANINLSKATYVYADVEKTFGGEVDTNWQWNLGVRYSF